MNGTDEPRFRLGLARATLAWEQIWPALWPATGIAGLFIAIALFNVLPSLGGWLHALVILLLFAVAFGAGSLVRRPAAFGCLMVRRRCAGWSATAA